MKNGTDRAYRDLNSYYGDLHNHCGISYAHGTAEEAYRNARLQLDFASVTGHAAWPDMDDRPMPQDVVDYHRQGFQKLRTNWDHYLAVTERHNTPGTFVTFFGFEYHSFRHGDRTFVSPDRLPTPDPDADYPTFQRLLQGTDARRDRMLLLPHHIGYSTGFRGIDWDSVTDGATPIVEILSMHGLAEGDGQWFPYLHTMGPLDPRNTMIEGLRQGHRFGVVASTDHHSAHPGSFGHGRTAVWAEECTREAIWEAILQRRTYAVSGDRIDLRFAINGAPMGSVLQEGPPQRQIEVAVRAGGALDRVELMRNGTPLHTWYRRQSADVAPRQQSTPATIHRGKVVVEMGWGEKGRAFDWDLTISLTGGTLLAVEPRLRGRDVVDPLDRSEGECHFSSWSRDGSTVSLKTRTFGNATTATAQTQAICFEVEGTGDTHLTIVVAGQTWHLTLAELLQQAQVMYTSGFVSPALRVHRFTPEQDYTCSFSLVDTREENDFYYVRVVQENGHGAWSSPIWCDPTGKGGTATR